MKSIGLLALWLLAGTAATGVAWTGIGVLDDDLVEPASNAVAVGELTSEETETGSESEAGDTDRSGSSGQAEGRNDDDDRDDHSDDDHSDEDDSTATSTSSATGSTETTATSSTVTTPTSRPTQTSTTSRASSTSSTVTTSPTTSPTAPTSQTTASTATTVSTTNTVQPTTQPGQTKTFHLVGGSTAISFSANGTTVVWATPNPGFDVDIEPESPGIKVEFRSDHHRSRIDAWWSNGPQHEIRERDD